MRPTRPVTCNPFAQNAMGRKVPSPGIGALDGRLLRGADWRSVRSASEAASVAGASHLFTHAPRVSGCASCRNGAPSGGRFPASQPWRRLARSRGRVPSPRRRDPPIRPRIEVAGPMALSNERNRAGCTTGTGSAFPLRSTDLGTRSRAARRILGTWTGNPSVGSPTRIPRIAPPAGPLPTALGGTPSSTGRGRQPSRW